jgi:hypothetical protein
MAGEQQPSFFERYDPDADYWGLLNNYAAGGAPSDIRAGAGDVVLEFGGMFIDAWLGAGGLKLLRGTPAALGRVKALVSTPSVGIGAFGRTPGVTSTVHIKEFANALGGGAALESFKAFVKNPANVREAVKWVRESGWRYSQGATPKLVPKKFRLNFTPVKPPGSPIVPAAPTP